MIDPYRFRHRMRELSLTQTEVARRVGLTQGAIAKIASGASLSSSSLHKLALALHTTPAYLECETDDPQDGFPTPEVVAEQLNSVLVPLYNFAASMGPGAVFDEAVDHEMVPFKKEWLRSHVAGRLDEVIMIYGRGDSMQPTINDGDVLMIDRSQTVIIDPDLIWAFSYGDAGYVKRLRRLPKGGYLIQSDNAVVKDFRASDDEVSIVGRIVSILRWQ